MIREEASSKKPNLALLLGVLVALAAVALAVVAFAVGGSAGYSVIPAGQEALRWEEVLPDGTTAATAVPISLDDDGKASITATLPQVGDGQSLLVKVNFSAIDVKVDGQTVYSLGETHLGPIHTRVGNYIAFVPLRQDYGGKTIQVDVAKRDQLFSSSIKFAGVVDTSAFLVAQAHLYLVNLIVAVLFCLFGILMLALWAAFSSRRIRLGGYERGAYVYAALLLFSIGVWTISDVHLMGIYLDRLTSSGLINYLSFGLLPIGCVGMTKHLYARSGRALSLLLCLAQINFVSQCVLFLAGIFDLPQMLLATQVLCILAIVALAVETMIDMRRDPAASKTTNMLTAIVVAVSLTVSIVLYILDRSMLSWLTFVIIVIVANIVLRLLSAAYRMMRDGIKFDEMRIHAYTDDLTGLANRRAYAEEVERIRSLGNRSNLVLGQIDVNGLKTTNDTLGHVAGDELLRAVSQCMSSCFGAFAKCYRMGGDEFSVLAFADKATYAEARGCFEEALASWQGEYVRSPSVSMGSAFQADHPRASVVELEREADAAMYQEKRSYYSGSGTDRRRGRAPLDDRLENT